MKSRRKSARNVPSELPLCRDIKVKLFYLTSLGKDDEIVLEDEFNEMGKKISSSYVVLKTGEPVYIYNNPQKNITKYTTAVPVPPEVRIDEEIKEGESRFYAYLKGIEGRRSKRTKVFLLKKLEKMKMPYRPNDQEIGEIVHDPGYSIINSSTLFSNINTAPVNSNRKPSVNDLMSLDQLLNSKTKEQQKEEITQLLNNLKNKK